MSSRGTRNRLPSEGKGKSNTSSPVLERGEANVNTLKDQIYRRSNQPKELDCSLVLMEERELRVLLMSLGRGQSSKDKQATSLDRPAERNIRGI